MDITTLMVAFLLHMQSHHDLTPLKAKEVLKSPRTIHHLIFQWADMRQWDLYIYMRYALEQFIQQGDKTNGKISRRRSRIPRRMLPRPKHPVAVSQDI